MPKVRCRSDLPTNYFLTPVYLTSGFSMGAGLAAVDIVSANTARPTGRILDATRKGEQANIFPTQINAVNRTDNGL
jgi:hypothetical protein